jgi:hypothetical protein
VEAAVGIEGADPRPRVRGGRRRERYACLAVEAKTCEAACGAE